MHVAGYMLFDKIQLVAFCCEAQKQPEDVEDVPETANALKQLKSAQGKGCNRWLAECQKHQYLRLRASDSRPNKLRYLDWWESTPGFRQTRQEKVFGILRTPKNFQTMNRTAC